MNTELNKKTILAVDDVSMNLIIIKNILTDYYDVRVAKSGKAALYILEKVEIDLILLDIEMPDMSGFDFISLRDTREEWKNIPIVLVTSHADTEIIVKAANYGVSGYIIKPIDSSILIDKVSSILK